MANPDSVSKSNETYQKMIGALQSLDFNHLNDLYTKRRTSFLESVKEDNHKEINSRLFYATITTDVCMEIYYDFLSALGQKVEEINTKTEKDIINHKTSTDEALGKLQGLLEEVQSKNKEEFTESYKNLFKGRQIIYEQVFQSRQGLAKFQSSVLAFNIFLVTLSSTATYGSLTRLFEITDLSLIGEVMILVLQTLVGLIPVAGTAATTLWGFYDIFDRKAKQYKKAGDLLTQLDNYTDVD